jgi:transcriptional regulator GlxA family with amidase domain
VSTRRPGDKHAACAQRVLPTHTFAAPPAQLDVVLVPGGAGCLDANEDALAFLREAYPRLKAIITVCTGSLVLAHTGLLDGRRATTNKAYFSFVAEQRKAVQWQPVARWVADGNIWTASGVAAGMDCMLAFIAQEYGLAMAEKIMNIAEYDWHRDAAWDPFAVVHKVEQA